VSFPIGSPHAAPTGYFSWKRDATRHLVQNQPMSSQPTLFPTITKDYTWPDLSVHWKKADTSKAAYIPQGSILGDGSSVMGMIALRGVPEDYDDWQAQGAEGWSWNDVLPFFNKLEADQDFGG
jgi:5-(hydroxymethyl)furfural/furfural oxidase